MIKPTISNDILRGIAALTVAEGLDDLAQVKKVMAEARLSFETAVEKLGQMKMEINNALKDLG